MHTYQLIREAVLNKRQITATYHGHVRHMCPHVLGRKDGRPQALFYQFGGGSDSGLPPGGKWRCLHLDELSNVSAQNGEWHTAASDPQLQTCVGDVDVAVAN